jgi:hypothetical protein
MNRSNLLYPCAVAGASAFLALLTLLHMLDRQIDPSWHFISEYALGSYGWMMTLAFATWALSFGAAAIIIWASGHGRAARAGATLLAISSLAAAVAAIFPSDPMVVGASQVSPSLSGTIHNVAGAAGLAMPLAIAVASFSLWSQPEWKGSRLALGIAAFVALVGFAVSFAWLATLLSASGGRFGPDVPIGWPNRLEVFGYCFWLIHLGFLGMRARKDEARVPLQ